MSAPITLEALRAALADVERLRMNSPKLIFHSEAELLRFCIEHAPIELVDHVIGLRRDGLILVNDLVPSGQIFRVPGFEEWNKL